MISEGGLGTPRRQRVVEAALAVFGEHGAAKSTLQMVARAAGVSVGLVQHHFGSKEKLVEAVNAHALTVIRTEMARPLTASSNESVLEMGRRVSFLLARQLAAVDYLADLLVEGAPAGAAFFDSTAEIGLARWRRLADEGGAAEDLDLVWAALNPLILVMGAVIMRRHIDRHLPEPFVSTAQLQRWRDAVNALLEHGQIRREPDQPKN